jgi:hypothetical protein
VNCSDVGGEVGRIPTVIRVTGGGQPGRESAAQPAHPLPHLLVAGVSIDRGGKRAHVPREPLRQKQVPARPVDLRDRRVPQRVKGVEPVESGLHLPSPECELDAALADAH